MDDRGNNHSAANCCGVGTALYALHGGYYCLTWLIAVFGIYCAGVTRRLERPGTTGIIGLYYRYLPIGSCDQRYSIYEGNFGELVVKKNKICQIFFPKCKLYFTFGKKYLT